MSYKHRIAEANCDALLKFQEIKDISNAKIMKSKPMLHIKQVIFTSIFFHEKVTVHSLKIEN